MFAETRDKRQETRDKRQETRDKRQETRDKRQETRDYKDFRLIVKKFSQIFSFLTFIINLYSIRSTIIVYSSQAYSRLGRFI